MSGSMSSPGPWGIGTSRCSNGIFRAAPSWNMVKKLICCCCRGHGEEETSRSVGLKKRDEGIPPLPPRPLAGIHRLSQGRVATGLAKNERSGSAAGIRNSPGSASLGARVIPPGGIRMFPDLEDPGIAIRALQLPPFRAPCSDPAGTGSAKPPTRRESGFRAWVRHMGNRNGTADSRKLQIVLPGGIESPMSQRQSERRPGHAASSDRTNGTLPPPPPASSPSCAGRPPDVAGSGQTRSPPRPPAQFPVPTCRSLSSASSRGWFSRRFSSTSSSSSAGPTASAPERPRS